MFAELVPLTWETFCDGSVSAQNVLPLYAALVLGVAVAALIRGWFRGWRDFRETEMPGVVSRAKAAARDELLIELGAAEYRVDPKTGVVKLEEVSKRISRPDLPSPGQFVYVDADCVKNSR